MNEGMQKIKAMIFEWISKAKNKTTLKTDKNDKIENVLKMTARLLLIHFEMNAVIVPAKALTSAIKDNTIAEL